MTTRTTIDVDGTVTVRDMTAEELAALAALAPSAEQSLAGRRAAATLDRGALCKALKAEGILSASSAIIAAKGDWPTEFATFLAALDQDAQFDAQVDWAAATTVRYAHPLLQAVALSHAGNEVAATVLLDQLFGIAAA